MLRRQKNVRVLLAEAQAIDTAQRLVVIDPGQHVPYDFLIVAATDNGTAVPRFRPTAG